MQRVPGARLQSSLLVVLLALVVGVSACADSGAAALTAEMPLHLEEHLDSARVEGSDLPKTIPATMEWRFDQPQPDWKAMPSYRGFGAPRTERTADALRVVLSDGARLPNGSLRGGIYVDLPDWRREEWTQIVVRAQTTGDTTVGRRRTWRSWRRRAQSSSGRTARPAGRGRPRHRS